ncbi:IclR family transcriptional regulator [Klebsiella pneumoniae]|uniref:IclR family transcriptional regulator n=1 Tax=Klebsiella pneumoniae TaxID=573 RepID=A0A2X3FGQ2_KLEPN|nr:IclR family transcriptional regulator [Klebsiella pneumoniae]
MSLRWVSRSSSNCAISASAAAIWRSATGRDIIYIARVSAAGSRINQVSVGTRLPVHCTSLGRMLLTDVSRSEFEQLFPDERLPGNAPGQLYDREALWQMVQQDKARGYVIGESFYRTASHRLSIRSLTAAAGWRRSSAFWCRRTRSRKAIASGCRTTSVWRRTKFPASSDICHRQVKSTT